MSLREDIRAFAASAASPVLMVPTPELPQWDGQIGVARVSARALAAHWQDSDEDEQIDDRARFVVLVACDAAGNRIFQEADVLWLSTSAVLSPMLERLYWAGRESCGLTPENRSDWKKNLPRPTAAAGSPSSLPERLTPDSAST